jgi:hypothetical protein
LVQQDGTDLFPGILENEPPLRAAFLLTRIHPAAAYGAGMLEARMGEIGVNMLDNGGSQSQASFIDYLMGSHTLVTP